MNPDVRFNMIKKFDGYVAEALCYKEIDRSQVHTRDLILADGQSYNEYRDPHHAAALHMWADIQKYEMHGNDCHNFGALKTSIHRLV